LQGLDALAFAAGIGEHTPEIRRPAREQASWCGLEIDSSANEA
jgi:acetate kinase